MIDRYIVIELSKLYKRMFEVELTLKRKMFFALKKTYQDKLFFRLIPYLKKLQNNSNEINKIINSTDKTEEQKLNKFLTSAYLSDVINILTLYKDVYRYKVFQKNFYSSEIDEIKHQEIISYAGKLISLRNSIMHFNVAMYQRNRKNYLNTLIYWEKLLACPNMKYIHNLTFNKKPQIAPTLRALSEAYPDFLTLSDRLVCDMFDDVAFINGWDINKLPEYWTIGRALHELKSNSKKQSKI